MSLIDSRGGGVLTLGGNVTYFSGTSALKNQNGQATISPNLDLGRATRTFSINDSNATATEMLVAGSIGGTAGLTKSGSGTLVLAGTNGYSGAATISGGIVQIGNGSTAGTLGNGTVSNAATLVFNRSDSCGGNVSNAISGAGGVAQSGAGTLTLRGANTYGGATSVTAGTLTLAAANALANTSSIPVNGATLSAVNYNSSATLSLDSGGLATISGTGLSLGTVTNANTTANALDFTSTSGTLTQSASQTWSSGRHYLFEITNADSTSGSGWDRLNITALSITATSGFGNQFVIDLKSLTSGTDQSAGAMSANWNKNYDYQWKFLLADAATFTASNFNTNWFTVNTTNFTNEANGSFQVACGGGDGGLGGSTCASKLYISSTPRCPSLARSYSRASASRWPAGRSRSADDLPGLEKVGCLPRFRGVGSVLLQVRGGRCPQLQSCQ